MVTAGGVVRYTAQAPLTFPLTTFITVLGNYTNPTNHLRHFWLTGFFFISNLTLYLPNLIPVNFFFLYSKGCWETRLTSCLLIQAIHWNVTLQQPVILSVHLSLVVYAIVLINKVNASQYFTSFLSKYDFTKWEVCYHLLICCKNLPSGLYLWLCCL